jgi:hypothetical protein
MTATSSLRAVALVVGYLVLGTAATLRHVARAITLRPAWTRVADSAPSFLWFGGAAFAAALVRGTLLGGGDLWGVMLGTMLHMVVIIVAIERDGQSSAPVFMCWAASAGIDLIGAVLLLLSVPANKGEVWMVLLAMELALYVILFRDFLRQPPAVRRRGYLRGAPRPRGDSQDIDVEDRKGGTGDVR